MCDSNTEVATITAAAMVKPIHTSKVVDMRKALEIHTHNKEALPTLRSRLLPKAGTEGDSNKAMTTGTVKGKPREAAGMVNSN